MANTDQLRDLKYLNKLVKVQLDLAIKDLKKQGVTVLVVETFRTLERQKWLYAQGRTKAECRARGIPEKYARSGSKVTSTLNSIHLTGCAVDVVPLRDGQAIWNANDKETKKIIKTMEKYGFECGANWTSFPDSPHYQVKGILQSSILYCKENTTPFVTKVIQNALNNKLSLSLKIDGIWGNKTTEAIDAFRIQSGYKKSSTIGTTLLKKLL